MNRVQAICELNVEAARAMSPPTDISDDMVLAGLHKARCEMADVFDEITDSMVDESKSWLSARGMTPGIR